MLQNAALRIQQENATTLHFTAGPTPWLVSSNAVTLLGQRTTLDEVRNYNEIGALKITPAPPELEKLVGQSTAQPIDAHFMAVERAATMLRGYAELAVSKRSKAAPWGCDVSTIVFKSPHDLVYTYDNHLDLLMKLRVPVEYRGSHTPIGLNSLVLRRILYFASKGSKFAADAMFPGSLGTSAWVIWSPCKTRFAAGAGVAGSKVLRY